MNRRAFLRFLGLAPVVGPAVVKAAVTAPQDGLWIYSASQITGEIGSIQGFVWHISPVRIIAMSGEWKRGLGEALSMVKG